LLFGWGSLTVSDVVATPAAGTAGR